MGLTLGVHFAVTKGAEELGPGCIDGIRIGGVARLHALGPLVALDHLPLVIAQEHGNGERLEERLPELAFQRQRLLYLVTLAGLLGQLLTGSPD